MVEAVILGLVQGFTEFLPVSSSTHLRFLHYFFGFDLSMNAVAFDVTLHCATVLAVIVVFRHELLSIIGGTFKAISPRMIGRLPRSWKENSDLRTSVYIVAASIMTFAVYMALKYFGLSLKDTVSADTAAERRMLLLFAGGLIVTGAILFSTLIANRYKQHRDPSLLIALILGAAQGFALIPGISRSGITIASALLLGIYPSYAGSFSFILSLPAIAGAAFMDIRTIAAIDPMLLVAGFVSAFASGYLALRFLLALIHRGSIFVFGFYCAIAGTAAIVYLIR